jgi:hypothetical protein
MTIPTKRNNSTSSSSKSSSTKTFVGFGSKDKASKNNFGNTLARILLFIPNQIINITCFFLRGRGRGLLGLGVFIWGLVISSDAYWQAANPGAPALTQFGTPEGKAVLGLWASLGLLLTPQWASFVGSVVTSTIIQVIEGMALRGNTPEEAKGTLDYYSQFDAGSAPSGKINRAKAAHDDFVNAGMIQYIIVGVAAIVCWIWDAVVTFSAHNPLNYWGEPMTVATVTVINIIKIFAAETGFAIMLRLNGRG